MAKVVSAVATSHILMSRAGAEAAADRVFEGMLEIGRHVRASQPDVVVIISSDHMFNIGPSVPAPFLVACGASFVPFGEMDIPREEYRGEPAFASDLQILPRRAARRCSASSRCARITVPRFRCSSPIPIGTSRWCRSTSTMTAIRRPRPPNVCASAHCCASSSRLGRPINALRSLPQADSHTGSVSKP